KHKLSVRLALLKDTLLLLVSVTAPLATAAIAGCEKPIGLTDLAADALSRVVVSPRVLTLRQNQTADFRAVGLTSTGDTTPVTVSWSVTSGSIVDTGSQNGNHYGRYKAGQDTGHVKVIAHGNPGGVSDTAIVTVAPVPVSSVTVTPASPSVL